MATKSVWLAIAVLVGGCGRTALIDPGQPDASTQGAGAGGSGGGAGSCNPGSLCAVSSPLGIGAVAKIGNVAGSGSGDFGITFDAQNRLVIAYFHDGVDVRRLEAGRWQQLGCPPASAQSINQLRMAMGPTGTIAVAHSGTNAKGVRELDVSRWDGTTWQTLPRPSVAAQAVDGTFALALVGQNPILAWGLVGPGGRIEVHVSRWNGAAWDAMGPALTGRLGKSRQVRSIALDRNNQPVILTLDGFGLSTSTQIEVLKWNGSSWTTLPPVPLRNPVPQSAPTIRIDHSDRVLVGWNDFPPTGPIGFAHVARFDSAVWTLLGEPLAPPGHLITDFALTPDDRPVVATTVRPPMDVDSSLSVRAWNGSGWDLVLANVLPNQVASDVMLAVNAMGAPAAIWATAQPTVIDVNVWQPTALTCP